MPPIKEATHPEKCRARKVVAPDPAPRLPTGGEPEGPPLRLVEDAAPLPSLEEVTRTRGSTMKQIPASVLDRWSRKFTSLLSAAMHFNDDRHWTVALMFAKCTLYTAHRGGRKAKTNTERVSAALDLYEAQRYADAWRVAMGPARPGRPQAHANSMERRVAQCVAQTRDGEYSRALAGLQSAEMAPPTVETLRLLQ